MREGTGRVWVVSCKSWQAGFDPKQRIAAIEGTRMLREAYVTELDVRARCCVCQFASLPGFTCFRIGSKLRCIRSTPTDMQSMSEDDFECFANTGVYTPRTMFPN